MSCDCYCSVALPHSVLYWSVVCDYGVSYCLADRNLSIHLNVLYKGIQVW